MTFGERLMKLRRERGLSQEALGDMVDVTRQTVSKWERGESTPELEKLMELARIFEISLDGLAGLEHDTGAEQSAPQPAPRPDWRWAAAPWEPSRPDTAPSVLWPLVKSRSVLWPLEAKPSAP